VRILIVLALAAAIFGSAGYFTWRLFIKPHEDLRMEKLLPPPPPPPDPTLPEFNKIVELQKAGRIAEARAGFSDFIEHYPESTKQDEAKNRLGEINSKLFFSSEMTPNKELYIVKPNDVITRVAARTKTSPEMIMRMNNLTGIMLRIGQKLIIPKTNFSLVINRKDERVVLLDGGKFFKQYAIRKEPVEKKKGTPAPGRQPKISGKVRDKIAWLDGSRVTFADKGFENADHWIVIQPSGHSLYTDREPGPNEPKPQKPPGGGYGLPAEHMQELAVLVSKNTPVTIE